MTKAAKKRKHGSEASAFSSKKIKQDVKISVAAPSDQMIGGILFEDELETTTDTLATLTKNPSLISLKALKPFKTAVHDYWRVSQEASNTG